MPEEKNEFDELDNMEEAPQQQESEVPQDNSDENLVTGGTPGQEYDWRNAPDGVKAPPRENLDGKTVIIKKADIILPPTDREWTVAKNNNNVRYKQCTFKLHYDVDGQQEFYSGVRVFKREENNKEKYSHPTIMRDRKSQASKLLGKYADYKGKDINEVTLKEFMAFLNGQPRATIKAEKVVNPQTDEEIHKNFVEKFLPPQ